ncbi:MAG: ABC transporter substrate-binding protein, partial [Actinomycetota bacterium]|nr:ABC transporter substrate-binding protein [Actinomycetota bacterium]
MLRASGRKAALALTAAIMVLAGCAEEQSGGDEGSPEESGPVVIGAVLDITGAGASLGVPERDTLELLADQLNA